MAGAARGMKVWGLVFVLVLAGWTGACSRQPRITVGSKNFTEQLILGEIIAQQIEREMHTDVRRKLDLGGTFLAQRAMLSGGIDLYPEYTGTALTAVLKQPVVKDPREALARVRTGYAQWHIRWMEPLGFENTFAMAIRRGDAESRNVHTLSEAGAYQAGWRMGAGYEFEQRPDGLPGLVKTYGLHVDGSVKTMDLGLLYRALAQNDVDMVAGNSTDGALSVLPVEVLKDDWRYFPPYEVAIIVREQALAEFPGLEAALSKLSGRISTEMMRRWNYEVDGKHHPVREVAEEALVEITQRPAAGTGLAPFR
jgi:glycine betaine/choline ABC-type transport system substrate-binding protein